MHLIKPFQFFFGLWPSILPHRPGGVSVLVVAFETLFRFEENLALITAEQRRVVDLQRNHYIFFKVFFPAHSYFQIISNCAEHVDSSALSRAKGFLRISSFSISRKKLVENLL